MENGREKNVMKKLISWNVNGLRACVGKGFLEYFKEADADAFCLQETEAAEGQIDLELPGITSTGLCRKEGVFRDCGVCEGGAAFGPERDRDRGA